MGLIEEAGRRLQELRNAGVEIPTRGIAPPRPRPPQEDRVAHRLERIDLEALAARGVVTPTSPASRLADEFRIVKRALLANLSPRRSPPLAFANVIMVTSSIPGEGKTFAALNLAMSIAMEMDHRVLLVDADVARPALPALLHVPEGPGLLDALAHRERRVENLIARTNVDKLEFMTAGTHHARANELLASDAMSTLVQELGRHPDRIVVFDSPPLLATAEAAALARHMGQVLFVVAAGSTPVQDVERALAAISACPVKLLLLNKVSRLGEPMHAYGYGYGVRT
jgi:protein-tyrosine kinase